MNILSDPAKLPALARKATSLTIQTAISEGTNLRSLKKMNESTPEVVEAAILNLLNYGRASLMIENSGDQQICLANMAIQIINDELNSCFTLEEIVLCIQNGINGKYGKSYHKLTFETINTWLDKYYSERMNFIDGRHQELKHSSGNQSDRASKGNELSDEFKSQVDEEVSKRMARFFESQRNKNTGA